MNKRLLIIFTIAAVAGIAAGALAATMSGRLFQGYKPTIEIPGEHKPAIEIPGERTLPDFTLTDQNGNAFTLSSLKNKAVVIYFGYTHCPDVCPLTLSKFKQTIERLGPEADKVAFIFVTVDPERDTPEVLKKYLSFYSEKIIGLSGSPEKVYSVLRLYNIYAAKNPPDEKGNYLVDHYALVMGADRNHILRIAFTPDMDVEEYVQGVKWLLSK
jgi:protein SCO1/2